MWYTILFIAGADFGSLAFVGLFRCPGLRYRSIYAWSVIRVVKAKYNSQTNGRESESPRRQSSAYFSYHHVNWKNRWKRWRIKRVINADDSDTSGGKLHIRVLMQRHFSETAAIWREFVPLMFPEHICNKTFFVIAKIFTCWW